MGTGSSESLLKRFSKFYHRSLSNKILIVLVVLLTLIRVWLAVKTPIDLRGRELYDDYLMGRAGYSLSKLQWLGEYTLDTFSKGISFPIWLAINHWLGLPYSLALILLHIFSFTLLIISLYRLCSKIPNISIYVFIAMYLLAIYTPITLDYSYVQLVYRNSYQVSLTCIVFACVLGAFAQRNEKGYLKWIIGLCISLPLFVTSKEDSDWIYLLIIPAFALIVIFLIFENKGFKRNLSKFGLLLVPFLIVGLVNFTWAELNYHNYGVKITTDRKDGNYARFISEVNNMSENDIPLEYPYWVNNKTIKKVIECSPTLQEYKEYFNIDDAKETFSPGTSGDTWLINGDITYWWFKWRLYNGGFYDDNTPLEVEEFFGKVCDEIEGARENGLIQSSKKIRISSSTGGYTVEEIQNNLIPDYFADMYKIATYYGISSIEPTYTEINNSTLDFLTKSYSAYPDNTGRTEMSIFVKLDNVIIKIYQTLSPFIFWMSILCGVVFFVIQIKRYRASIKLFEVALPLLGVITICFGYFFAIEWFCGSFGFHQNYGFFKNYAGNVELIMFMLRIFFIGFVVSFLASKVKRNYKIHRRQA